MAGRKPAPLDREGLMQYALRVLTMRAQTTSEMRTRLLRRAQNAADADTVMAHLEEAGFLNDKRFAESYAAARLENQKFGKHRVLRDLRTRRVTSEVAQSAVEQVFEGTDETDLIEQFLARKYRGKDLPSLFSDDRQLLSAYRKLRLGGFAAGPSIRVLKRYAAQADALEETPGE